MKVTEIEELSKTRSRVTLEDGVSMVLYRGELRTYRVAAGEEIAREDYEAIMGQVLPKRAKLRAMNLLKSRDYTVRQLRDRLKKGGYPESVIDGALACVADYRYTDDLRYALNYISARENTCGVRRIQQDLLARGVDRETLERAWQKWRERGGSQDEEQMLKEFLEKHHYDPRTAQAKEKRRMYACLMRKGFSGEQVCRALRMEEMI